MREIDVRTFITHRMVKSEDLNHHGTLFAGRSAEWFVEAGFIAAASLCRPEHIGCLHIHGMTFTCLAHCGDILRFESKGVLAGRTRLVAHVRVQVGEQVSVEGFNPFIHVDREGQLLPHGIQLEVKNADDCELQKQAEEPFK